MPQPVAFRRESGSGPTVICLHSNASHSGQWRGLMEQLAGRFHVVAVDSYGSGKTAEWHSDRVIRLADEVELLAPVIAAASMPAYLVGHSYGASVALKAALMHPGRFGGLALYEPTFFTIVERVTRRDVDGIREAVATSAACLDRGDTDGAARSFIDFWMGAGSWDATPAERKPAMAQSVKNIRRWAHALMTDPATVQELRKLTAPVLCMTGGKSPRSSLSVAEMLMGILPNAQRVAFPGLGHMAPVTHPEPVNTEIERFLQEVAR